MTNEEILLLVCQHTGKRINLTVAECHEHIDFARAIEARAIPLAAAEPVLWVESEPSTRLLDLSEVIQGMCHSVMYHTREPRTSNPVWPLYTRSAPDRAPSTDDRCTLTDAELADPEYVRGYIEGCNESFRQAMEEIKRLKGAPSTDSATERDAARYRWLCANNFDRQSTQVHTWLHYWEPHSKTGEPTEWKQRVRGGALDATIDAAIAAMKGEAHG